MTGLSVSELAGRAGVAPSTVRFYERTGLLSTAQRAGNGYRLFDESAIGELLFIARAKGIGLTLDEIQELVRVWPTGQCHMLQARLPGFLERHLAQVRVQAEDLGGFERQLVAVLNRLAARSPGPEQCGKGCGCEADLDAGAERDQIRTDRSIPPVVRGVVRAFGSLAGWGTVIAGAHSVTTTREGFTAEFASNEASLADVSSACLETARRLNDVRFSLEIGPTCFVLTVSGSSREDLERLSGATLDDVAGEPS